MRAAACARGGCRLRVSASSTLHVTTSGVVIVIAHSLPPCLQCYAPAADAPADGKQPTQPRAKNGDIPSSFPLALAVSLALTLALVFDARLLHDVTDALLELVDAPAHLVDLADDTV